MRIAMFSEVPCFNPIFPNGVSAFIEATSKQLAKLGHEIHIYEGKSWFGQKEEEQICDNIIMHRLFSLPISKYQNFRVVFPLGTIFRGVKLKFDIIHAHGPMNGLVATIVAKKLNCTKVITYHTPSAQYRQYAPLILPIGRSIKVLEWYERNVYNSFDLITTPAKKWKNNLMEQGFDGHKIFVLPNCVNIKENYERVNPERIQSLREKYSLNGKRVVIYVGRMSPEKRIPDIINLVPQIIKEEPDTHFLMIGKGPYLEDYRQLAQRVAPHDITFTGFVSDQDLANIMQISNLGLIFVDGAQVFDITLLNYWSNRLPVCVRRAGGMGEVITHYEDGLLFDKTTEAYSFILNLLQDEHLSKKLGAKGFQTVKNKYSVEVVTNQLLDLYKLASRKYHIKGDDLVAHMWRYIRRKK